jgi:hypothetical protein
MDEQLRISLWIVSGGGLGAVLGGAFGGLAGMLHARSGHSAGTGFGRRVAATFARTAEHETSFSRHGAIAGAADGVLFLGTIGALLGALVGSVGKLDPRWLGMAALGSILLVGAAAFFGILAYALARNGMRAAFYVFGGGLLGSFLVAQFLGANLSPVGTLIGFVVGLALSFVTRRSTPRFPLPDVDEDAPFLRSDAPTTITGAPHARQDIDSFRQPDPFEEL